MSLPLAASSYAADDKAKASERAEQQGAKADTDKNNRLSVWEAFTYASQAVKQAYEKQGTLVTDTLPEQFDRMRGRQFSDRAPE